MKLLLEKAADVNSEDFEYSRTPMLRAAGNGSSEAAREELPMWILRITMV
jgi:hypothetical protein